MVGGAPSVRTSMKPDSLQPAFPRLPGQRRPPPAPEPLKPLVDVGGVGRCSSRQFIGAGEAGALLATPPSPATASEYLRLRSSSGWVWTLRRAPRRGEDQGGNPSLPRRPLPLKTLGSAGGTGRVKPGDGAGTNPVHNC